MITECSTFYYMKTTIFNEDRMRLGIFKQVCSCSQLSLSLHMNHYEADCTDNELQNIFSS